MRSEKNQLTATFYNKKYIISTIQKFKTFFCQLYSAASDLNPPPTHTSKLRRFTKASLPRFPTTDTEGATRFKSAHSVGEYRLCLNSIVSYIAVYSCISISFSQYGVVNYVSTSLFCIVDVKSFYFAITDYLALN